MAKKSKRQISIRTITTWTSVASFGLYAVIVGLTAWFVVHTLHSVGQPPAETGDTGAKPLESVNVRLMENLEEALEEKTSSPIEDVSSLTNPFLPRSVSSAPTTSTQPSDSAAETSSGASEPDEASTPESPAEEPAAAEADSGTGATPADAD